MSQQMKCTHIVLWASSIRKEIQKTIKSLTFLLWWAKPCILYISMLRQVCFRNRDGHIKSSRNKEKKSSSFLFKGQKKQMSHVQSTHQLNPRKIMIYCPLTIQ